MTRKNIFDILEEQMNIHEEIIRLENLCSDNVFEKWDLLYTLEQYVDEFCLPNWKSRNRCISCEEMRQKLSIKNFNIRQKLHGNQVLLYLEYLSNLIYLCESNLETDNDCEIFQTYIYLKDNLSEIILSLNYEEKVFEDEEKVLLVEKSASVTSVVEIVEPELTYPIIEYNHYLLKGNIAKKQKILKVLADKFESMRSDLKKINKTLESDTGYLLNKMNIRHNNIKGQNAIPYVQNISDEELEEWYDETYQMILLCILEYDNIERTKKVKNLKDIIENKKAE